MDKITVTDIKNLFIITFFASMLLGIIVFSAYFIDIQYFPVSNLASILYLPVITGLIGFMLLISFSGLVGFAPYMWAELLKDKNICRRIVGSGHTEHVMCTYRANFVDLNQKCRMQIFRWYAGTMLCCISLWFLAAEQEKNIFFVLLFILGCAGKYWVLLNQNKNTPSSINSLENNKISCLRVLTKIICYSLLPGLALFIVIVALTNLVETKNTLFQTMFVIAIIFTSSLCLLPFSNKWKFLNWTVIVSMASIILFITFLGIFTNLSKNIIHLFKFGNINNASMIIDEVGCDIFKLNGFGLDCSKKQKRYKIKRVNVLWRANEVYIQDTNHPTIKFIFAEKHALSISII